MDSFPVPVEHKIVRNVQSVRTYVTELAQSNTPINFTESKKLASLFPCVPDNATMVSYQVNNENVFLGQSNNETMLKLPVK